MASRSPLLSRTLSVLLLCAGVFSGILGAGGAPAQEATPQATATQAAATETIAAEPTTTVAPAATAPAQPAAPAETASPAATAEVAPSATEPPAASPAATAERTPDATPAPADEPRAATTPAERSQPRERPRKRTRRRAARPSADDAVRTEADADEHEDEDEDAETCTDPVDRADPDADADADAVAGTVAAATAGGLAGQEPVVLSGEFPGKAAARPSTSTEDCEIVDDTGESKRTPKKRRHADRHGDAHAHADAEADPHTARPAPTVRSDGSPAQANPTFSLATPGPARVGVPNFFIEKFRIPPFLLPIYQAAGMQYGIRWELLAAINEIETDYGRNLNVSSAGALGWMQFMPATWKMYGTDANRDGQKDPFNPVDAIFAAARYLKAAGGEKDVRKAVFAYNHANWYVDSVLMRARLIGGLPVDFTASLTGLTQGRFPVHARSTYAGQVKPGTAARKVRQGNVANVVASDERRDGIDVFAREDAPVVAVNDGRILQVGRSERLGRYVRLQDVYGNVFTYGGLGEVAKTYPAPRERTVSPAKVRRELDLPRDPKPTRAASAGTQRAARKRPVRRATRPAAKPKPAPALPAKERLFAHPARPAARAAGGERQLVPGDYDPAADDLPHFDSDSFVARPLRRGARVIGGTILGRIGSRTREKGSHLRFEVRPAGRRTPRIDPKPILDGWKLLESTAVYRAKGKNPFFGEDAEQASIGQILLMSKDALERRVLENPRIDLYACGREDIRSGAIDRRVLATLEFLAASGLRPTVSSLRCGHGYLTASGNVSHHSTGDAVDIAAVNGVPIMGNQGRGSITDTTIRRLLNLQGTMRPSQIISLMTFKDAENTIAMGDHADHIHLGWQPLYSARGAKGAKLVDATLKPGQWIKLIDRLAEIDNPSVRAKPSRYSLRVRRPN